MSEAQATPAPGFLFTDEILRDPYPTYRRFLKDDQILHSVPYGGRGWAVFRHAACSSLIRDPRLSARRVGAAFLALPPERRAEFGEFARMLTLWLLFIDAPEHSRLRKLMNRGFCPAVAEGLRPRIEAIVDRMLEPMRHASETDILRAIAYPLPVRVIAEMFGVPETQHERFIPWSDAIGMFLGNPQRTVQQTQAAQEAALALTEFFRGAVAERRRQKGSDLISLLLDIEEDGEVLTEEELYAQCVMLFGAGHETTRNLIGNGMYTLLRHPEEMAELRKNPELIRSAVEELLRYESPVQFAGRIASEEMEIGGVRVRQGQAIVFMLGAANRDPQQFKDPDRLDLKRSNNPHLAFGVGEHFCIGNQLARLEGQVAILKMVQQFPRMRLTTQRPEWASNYGLRGLKALPVVV
jgi:cytochrome P450